MDKVYEELSVSYSKERIAILQKAIKEFGLTEELFELYAKEMRYWC